VFKAQQERKVQEVLTEMKEPKVRRAYKDFVEYRVYKELLVLGLHRRKERRELKEHRVHLFKVHRELLVLKAH
jgi:hypothetical protein